MIKTKAEDKLKKFIIKASKIHKNFYDYSLVQPFTNKTQLIKILCPKHGTFEQKIERHETGSGCQICKFEKLSQYFVSNKNEFILKAKKIHGNKYNYDKFVYTKSWNKSIILCDIHKSFLCSPNKHLMGRGCPKCGKITQGLKRMTCPNEILKRFNKIHDNKFTKTPQKAYEFIRGSVTLPQNVF